MSMSGLLKFATGFTLAIAVLFFAGVNAARYLITRLTALPPRPVFENDAPLEADVSSASPSPNAPTAPSPVAASSPEPSPSPSPLEAGAYEAKVVQPIGLILREEPTTTSTQLGGVAYNEEVVVLDTSADGDWIQVRLPSSGVEGWVKSGNTERIEE